MENSRRNSTSGRTDPSSFGFQEDQIGLNEKCLER